MFSFLHHVSEDVITILLSSASQKMSVEGTPTSDSYVINVDSQKPDGSMVFTRELLDTLRDFPQPRALSASAPVPSRRACRRLCIAGITPVGSVRETSQSVKSSTT
jgi:hypothetical protein